MWVKCRCLSRKNGGLHVRCYVCTTSPSKNRMTKLNTPSPPPTSPAENAPPKNGSNDRSLDRGPRLKKISGRPCPLPARGLVVRGEIGRRERTSGSAGSASVGCEIEGEGQKGNGSSLYQDPPRGAQWKPIGSVGWSIGHPLEGSGSSISQFSAYQSHSSNRN